MPREWECRVCGHVVTEWETHTRTRNQPGGSQTSVIHRRLRQSFAQQLPGRVLCDHAVSHRYVSGSHEARIPPSRYRYPAHPVLCGVCRLAAASLRIITVLAQRKLVGDIRLYFSATGVLSGVCFGIVMVILVVLTVMVARLPGCGMVGVSTGAAFGYDALPLIQGSPGDERPSSASWFLP